MTGIYAALFSIIWGSIVYEYLWDKNPTDAALNPGECPQGFLREYMMFNVWGLAYIYLFFLSCVMLGPGSCNCCRMKTYRGLITFYILFGCLIFAGWTWGLVAVFAQAVVCADNTPWLYSSAMFFWSEITIAVLTIFCYIVWYFLAAYRKREAAKKAISLLQTKSTFDFKALSKLRKEEKDEDDEASQKKRRMAEFKFRERAEEEKRKEDERQAKEQAEKQAAEEAAKRRAEFFGDDSD
jgi:hypothetical protein